MYDIAILGNGILALTSAYFLNKIDPTLSIAVVGSKEQNGASLNAGAMLHCFAEITSDTFRTEHGKAKFEMSLESLKLWPGFIEEINSQLPDRYKLEVLHGSYVILNSVSGKLDCSNYYSMIKALDEYSQPYEKVHASNIPGLNPSSNCRPTQSVYLPNEGSIEPSKLIEALQYILSSKNVNFISNNAQRIELPNSMLLDTGEAISADKILICAGAFSQKLIDSVPELKNKTPKIVSGTGHAIVIDQVLDDTINNVIRTPNRSGSCGLHVVPQQGEQLYIGATNNVCVTPAENPKSGLIRFLLQCGIEQVNQKLYNSNFKALKTGNRPVSFDTFPLIGKTQIDNLFILTGTYRDGLFLSPYISHLIAKIITDKNVKQPLLFQPERKLIKTYNSKQESIDETVNHYIAGLYEHDFYLPPLFPEDRLHNVLQTRFTRIYEMLETNFPLPTDILFMFELDKVNEEYISLFKEHIKSCT